MHGGGIGIVEGAEAVYALRRGRHFFHQRVQEIGCVEQVGDAVLQGAGRRCQVKRDGHGGGGAGDGGCARFTEIFCQDVAAE